MPKLIDYPRTSYTSAWEVAEVVDDTGGKCALETCARKLNRKVSGSFKAIVGSAVKFGLLTSKREILTTTTLFRRIKHAYDKQEELLFHREAFLTPPLFAQVCRKFRSRELPVAMLDVLLIREFDVEEINAQSVAKAFIDGAHMVGILDEHNMVADIDQLAARQPPRRELASATPDSNSFRQTPATQPILAEDPEANNVLNDTTETATSKPATNPATITTASGLKLPSSRPAPSGTGDAIANLFGLSNNSPAPADNLPTGIAVTSTAPAATPATTAASNQAANRAGLPATTYQTAERPVTATSVPPLFRLQLTGPGLNTDLDVTDADDLMLVRALLDKIERQLRRPN